MKKKTRTVYMGPTGRRPARRLGCVLEAYAMAIAGGGVDIHVHFPQTGGRLTAHLPGKANETHLEEALASFEPVLREISEKWKKHFSKHRKRPGAKKRRSKPLRGKR